METFWENFWPNLTAGAVIAFLFGYLFVKWTEFYKRPKLSLVISDIKKIDTEKRIALLTARNSGKTTIADREANYHIYLPKGVNLDLYKNIEKMGNSEINGCPYTHYSQFNAMPIFPEREIEVLYLKYIKGELETNRIYYHFATAYGLMPKRGSWFRKINDKNGNIKLEMLPYLKLD